MEYYVDFKGGDVLIAQEYKNKKLSISLELPLVPKINMALENAKLPNLYQWASYGLNLQILTKLQFGAIGFIAFKDDNNQELAKEAKELMESTSINLTGSTQLGDEILAIMRDHICSKPLEEFKTAKYELEQQWGNIKNLLEIDIFDD